MKSLGIGHLSLVIDHWSVVIGQRSLVFGGGSLVELANGCWSRAPVFGTWPLVIGH